MARLASSLLNPKVVKAIVDNGNYSSYRCSKGVSVKGVSVKGVKLTIGDIIKVKKKRRKEKLVVRTMIKVK